MRIVKSSHAAMVLGILVIGGCAYSHPGPSPPEGDGLDSSAATSPALSPGPSLPAAHPVPKAKEHDIDPNYSNSDPVGTAPPVAPMSRPVNPLLSAPPGTPAPMTGSSGEDAGSASDSGSSFDNLEIIDTALNGKLGILRVGSEPTPNGLLSVFAGLKNKTPERLYLEVETLYKDKSGNDLNEGSWIPMTLKAHEESEYRSASISPLAADFLVRVRRAQGEEPAP